MSFIYEKYCGTGNDFLIVDIRGKKENFEHHAQGMSRDVWAKKLCDRHFGLGADGLVLIENSESQDFKWDFYNSDGSSAEMCGNAARCVGKWAVQHASDILKNKKSVSVETLAGPISIEVTDQGLFQVKMSPIQKAEFKQKLLFDKQDIVYSFVDSGVPHAVIELNQLSDMEAKKPLARFLRNHSQFGAKGTNVTFYSRRSESEIDAVSFERGVEDFTLACGTGAVAAAYDLYKQTKRGEIKVHLPGGELQIRFLAASPLLIGPAIKIADCTLSGYTK